MEEHLSAAGRTSGRDFTSLHMQLPTPKPHTTILHRFPGHKYYTKVAKLLGLWYVYENNSPYFKIELTIYVPCRGVSVLASS